MPSTKADHSQGLLLFRLHNQQVFALGTLKIQELVPFQPVTPMVNQHPSILGALNVRGQTMPIVDLAAAVGKGATPKDTLASSFIIITDVQRQKVGFLVRQIERIADTNWRDISAPDKFLGSSTYITGVTKVDNQLVQLLDVEVIMARLFPLDPSKATATITDMEREQLRPMNILLVDDSRTARKQLSDSLDAINVRYQVTDDGQKALDLMRTSAQQGQPIDLLVSDIEMPGLDGYELAFAVRDDKQLANAYIILHTSLSSSISVSQARQVGADEALTKFDARELIDAMLRGATKKHRK
ncbi:chemotaxis protein [Cellvibrio fibrivorans]|uniref:Two-component system chemotaxis response regulator CheV n=1 Tax=Cellvibrio fibrivorans TaxID=126350 RepID=A0ABU1V1L7_9GAMM|nr:chemotaxis protein [Cellvibrio fibrivorans]MDR7091335.1 two-component system chemotaxis response regulator CheV [Cellvibrio fibrivorans]